MIEKTPRNIALAAGLPRYEGLPCKHGHGTTRYSANHACVECKRISKKNLRAKKRIPKIKIVLTAEQQMAIRELKNAYHRAYWKKPENYGRKRAKKANRRCAELQRTPQWLTIEDKYQIKSIYNLAVAQSELHQTPYEVDHIIPLQGKFVSGLHVPANLQVMPQNENRKKSNY
jgi:hypothetical protein